MPTCLLLTCMVNMALNQLPAQQLLSLILAHTATVVPETNKYMRHLLIDYSKAYDSVEHAIIVKKLIEHGLDRNVIDWAVSFLSDRQQYTEVVHKHLVLL